MELSDVDPELYEPHLSNRVVAAVIAELDATVGSATVDAILAEVGMPRAYVTDPEHWVSAKFVHRFARGVARTVYALDELPPHDHEMWQHWRLAARHALSPKVIGPIYRVLRAFGSPYRFYQTVPSLHARATRRTTSQLRSLSRDRAVLSVRPVAGASLESSNCWFQYGLFEAAPALWGLGPATVEHRECMLDAEHPAQACVYRIRFEQRWPALPLSAAVSIVGGGLAGGIIAGVFGLDAILLGITGAAVGAAIEGWRRYLQANRSARREATDLGGLLREADERQAELWDEHVALRRSMLVTQKLSGYLARDLTERILRHPELALTLGGRQVDAAVLFVDVVGFTARCERMGPVRLVEELNIFFSHIDPNVVATGGIIDKRLGDGIMAVFVAREDDPDDVAARAMRCTTGMLASLETCNAELAGRNAEPFEVRIGVASGELVQGNMGSDAQLEYTVIGDVVNLAARLEAAARPGTALVPATLLARLPEAQRSTLELGEHRSIGVKGRTGTFEVVEVRAS